MVATGSGSDDQATARSSAFGDAAMADGVEQEPSLFDAYWSVFEEIAATGDPRDSSLLEACHRLRYQVYVTERGFEDPNDHAEGLEKDPFDPFSDHALLRHRQSGEFAGTVRLVLPQQLDRAVCYPIQLVCTDPLLEDPQRFPLERMGEVSRFCISKNFRRRVTDATYPDEIEQPPKDAVNQRRVIPFMMIGLIEGLVRMSVEHGVTYWCAAMEPQLLRLLTRIGIHFDHIGPVVDYHGRRQPCYKHLPTLLDRVHDEHPEIWEVLTMQGRYAERLRELDS